MGASYKIIGINLIINLINSEKIMITIYQLDKSHLSDSLELIAMFTHLKKYPKQSDIIKALELGYYHKAAEVDTSNLEEAFTKTTSEQFPWSEDSGVIMLCPECRNTDIGDLALLNDKLYFISGLGYTELPEETVELLPKERVLESVSII